MNTTFDFSELDAFLAEVEVLGPQEFEGALNACLDQLNVITLAEANQVVVRPADADEANGKIGILALQALLIDGLSEVLAGTSTTIKPAVQDVYCPDYTRDLPPFVKPAECTANFFDKFTCECFYLKVTADTCAEIYIVEASAQVQFDDAMSDLYDDVQAIKDQALMLESSIAEAKGEFEMKQDVMTNELYTFFDGLEGISSCGFIGDAYRNLKEQACTTMMQGLNWIVMSLFFVPLFTIPIFILSITLVKRIDSLDPHLAPLDLKKSIRKLTESVRSPSMYGLDGGRSPRSPMSAIVADIDPKYADEREHQNRRPKRRRDRRAPIALTPVVAPHHA